MPRRESGSSLSRSGYDVIQQVGQAVGHRVPHRAPPGRIWVCVRYTRAEALAFTTASLRGATATHRLPVEALTVYQAASAARTWLEDRAAPRRKGHAPFAGGSPYRVPGRFLARRGAVAGRHPPRAPGWKTAPLRGATATHRLPVEALTVYQAGFSPAVAPLRDGIRRAHLPRRPRRSAAQGPRTACRWEPLPCTRQASLL